MVGFDVLVNAKRRMKADCVQEYEDAQLPSRVWAFLIRREVQYSFLRLPPRNTVRRLTPILRPFRNGSHERHKSQSFD